VDSELISGLMEQLKISFLEIGMLATGNLARDAGLVPFITQMGVNMRENGKTITSMVRVYLHSKMDLNTLVHLIRIAWWREKSLWRMSNKQLLKILLTRKMMGKVKMIKVKPIQKQANQKWKVNRPIQLWNLFLRLLSDKLN
jgi:hypothetical protein